MQAVKLKITKIIAQNPHLMQSLDRTIYDPLIEKYSHIPLINY